MLNVFGLKRGGKFVDVVDLMKRLGENYYAALKLINEDDGFVQDENGFISRFLEVHKDVKEMLEALAETALGVQGIGRVEEFPEDEVVALSDFVEGSPAMSAREGFLEDKGMAVKKKAAAKKAAPKAEKVFKWVLRNGSPRKAEQVCKGLYLDVEKGDRFRSNFAYDSRDKAREAARKLRK